MSYLARDCPLCAEPAPVELEVTAKHRAEDLPFEIVAEAWRGFRREAIFFSYARCGRCGLLFCPKYLTDEQTDSLYSAMPDNTDGVAESALSRTHRGYARRIASRRSEGAVLEIGADVGLTLEQLSRLGRYESLTAVEPNLEVHEALQQRLGALRIYAQLEGIPAEERFGVVVAVHVFDHLVDLRGALTRLARHTDSGSCIGVVVHNERSLLRYGLGRRWPAMCLQHPQLFNPSTLTRTLRAGGWTNIEVRRTYNHFPLNHLARVARDIAPLPSSLTGWAPDVALPLPLGNVIATAER